MIDSKAVMFPTEAAVTCPTCARDHFVPFHQDAAGAYMPDEGEQFIKCGCDCLIEVVGFNVVEVPDHA